MEQDATSHARALVAALAAALLMGSLCVFVRESGCSAQLCSFARFGVGFALIGIGAVWMKLRGGISLAFSPAAFVSGVSIGLCILFYYLAIRHTSAGIAALLPASGPMLSAVWESLFKRRLPPRRDVMLLCTACMGIVLVTCFSEAKQGEQEEALGLFYGILCGVFYSFYLVLNRCMSAEVSMIRRVYWQALAGTVALLPPLVLMEQPLSGVGEGWPWLLGIGVLQGVGVLALVAYAMRRLNSLEFGIISCMEPTEAALLGWLVYAESILPGQWLGFALVFGTIIAKSQRHMGRRISLRIARSLRRHRARA